LHKKKARFARLFYRWAVVVALPRLAAGSRRADAISDYRIGKARRLFGLSLQ
jgi:hypothetical protein